MTYAPPYDAQNAASQEPLMICRVCIFLVAIVITTLPASAQEQEASRPTRITLYPAAAPRPVLKYRFTTPYIDRIPGNAAVYYGKVKFEQNAFFSKWREHVENAERWMTMPLDDLRRENASMPFPTWCIEEAARCESCDWQLPIRREWFAGILLPDVQELRNFGRYMAAQIRIDTARGDFESAVKRMRLCYTMAGHVAEGETIVNGLVGIAICGMTSNQALELVQQPGAPNLYWAWSELPAPLIDFREAIDVIEDDAALTVPEMRRVHEPGGTADQWRTTLFDVWTKVRDMSDEPRWKKTPEFLVASSLRNYPQAKRSLVELGWTADEIDRLPVAQVILLAAATNQRALQNEAAVAFDMPYPAASARLQKVESQIAALEVEGRNTLFAAGWGLGPLTSARTAQARVQREFAVLQLLEALRIHAAANGGRLPGKLADVTEVPVPEDPVTDAPFDYELAGGIARLRSPKISDVSIDYAILMSELPK
jgi:hypothetical protein